jgi:hypothetical protein
VDPQNTNMITTVAATMRGDRAATLAEYSMWRNVSAKSCNAHTPQG